MCGKRGGDVPNEENLKPVRTKSEARKRGKNGGKASGEARRRRKTLRENMELLLELPVSPPEDYCILAELGVDPADTDNSMLLTAALFQKAKSGDVAAYKEIRDLIGEGGDAGNGDLSKLIAGLKDE